MIAIWGANGFIGRHCAHDLMTQSTHPLTLFARDFTDFPLSADERLTLVNANFKDTPCIEALNESQHIILTVSASGARTFADQPDQERSENYQPYQNFFSALNALDQKNRHIIYLSSGGTVYGESPNRTPLKETAPCTPLSPYGQTKLDIENALIQHCNKSGDTYTILRVANPIGPWHKGRGILNALLQAARTNDIVNIQNKGQTIRDYFAVQDLADAITRACAPSTPHNNILNIGSGQGLSINDLIALVEETIHQKININYIDAVETDVDYNVLDCTKSKDVLGWQATTPLADVINQMWNQL